MTTGISNPAPRPERVVTLVHWVKGKLEMGCTTYSEEKDVEVVGHWLRKVERVIDLVLEFLVEISGIRILM